MFEVVNENGKFYTKGLTDTLEIEINLELGIDEGKNLCMVVGNKIIEGLNVEDGLLIKDILPCPIYLFKVSSINKDMYRVVLPDENGFFPWDIYNGVRCQQPYKEQISFDRLKIFYYQLKTTAAEFKEFNKVLTDTYSSILLPFTYFDGFAKSLPFKFLTSKNEVFYIGGYNLRNEEQKQYLLEELLNTKLTIYCEDANEEEIGNFQRLMKLRDNEI